MSAPGSLPATFGQELVRGLLNADPTLAVPSAAVAVHLLRGNPNAKTHLLTLPVEAPPATGGPLRYILPTLATTVTGYFGHQGAHMGWRASVCVALATHPFLRLTQLRSCAGRGTRTPAGHGGGHAADCVAGRLPCRHLGAAGAARCGGHVCGRHCRKVRVKEGGGCVAQGAQTTSAEMRPTSTIFAGRPCATISCAVSLQCCWASVCCFAATTCR